MKASQSITDRKETMLYYKSLCLTMQMYADLHTFTEKKSKHWIKSGSKLLFHFA